jgi:hypothetical protein
LNRRGGHILRQYESRRQSSEESYMNGVHGQ